MTKAKVAGEKPPSSRAGYKSPYFQKKRLRLKETPKEKRSNYFLRSPVSTYGAVMQMEPFLFSLSDNFPSVIPRCQQRTAESPCDSCIPIINEALSHFFMCKAFQECYPDILKKLQHNNSSIPCWKQSDQAIQQSVRHLCPYRCYLRAYSPFREWLFVRRDVHKVTDFPLGKFSLLLTTDLFTCCYSCTLTHIFCKDVLFDGWKCKLNYSVGNESLFAQNSSSETGSLPRVVFISPDGKVRKMSY